MARQIPIAMNRLGSFRRSQAQGRHHGSSSNDGGGSSPAVVTQRVRKEDESSNMSEQKRPGSRRDRHAPQNASSSSSGAVQPNANGSRGRRRAGGGGSGSASGSGGHHQHQQHRPATTEDSRRRRRHLSPPRERRLANQQEEQPASPPAAAAASGNGGGGGSSNKQRYNKSKKEIHSSVVAAIDALDSFKTTYKPQLSAPKIKYKKLGSSSNATSGASPAAAPQESIIVNEPMINYAVNNMSGAVAGSYYTNPIPAANPNSRQMTRNVSQNYGRRSKNNPQQQQQQQQLLSTYNGRGGNIGDSVNSLISRTQPIIQKIPPPPRQSQRQIAPIKSSPADIIPPRLQHDLQTRRRQALDVTCVYNEDGTVECDVVPGLVNADPSAVYEFRFSSDAAIFDAQDGEDNPATDKSIASKSTMDGAGVTLGKNGWHRALDVVVDSSEVEKASTTRSVKSQASHVSETSSAMSQLDQLTVTHILQNVAPQIDEYDAIREEYSYLMSEIKSLEKDRVQLEQLFHKAGRDATKKSLEGKDGKKLTYRKFRSNLRYMKAEDLRLLPLIWLEDVPLSYPENDSRKNRKLYAKLDKQFQDKIRNHRGVGLALLIADPQCKKSLIARCYMNNNYGTGRQLSQSAMLKREGAATLIDEGGEWLRHCAITGFDKANSDSPRGGGDHISNTGDNAKGVDALGTTYFLKFDNGKTHHRGDLPSNLRERLFREGRDHTTIKYLSTGCSYSASGIEGGSGHRCYYAEFDDGEVWWGAGEKDDVLDEIFTKMDIHRVAFGNNSSGGGSSSANKSSFVVIGKDGSVKWRNIPQGLHDTLIEVGNTDMATTTSDNVISFRGAPDSPGPCEISLGIAGTYFVRFTDGRVDYSLPNFVADVFDKFEADGKAIRNVALHVDTYDCLIRYSIEGNEDDDN